MKIRHHANRNKIILQRHRNLVSEYAAVLMFDNT